MIDAHSVRKACEIIMTCCILHNVCIMENDVFDDDLADEGFNDNKANMCLEFFLMLKVFAKETVLHKTVFKFLMH